MNYDVNQDSDTYIALLKIASKYGQKAASLELAKFYAGQNKHAKNENLNKKISDIYLTTASEQGSKKATELLSKGGYQISTLNSKPGNKFSARR